MLPITWHGRRRSRCAKLFYASASELEAEAQEIDKLAYLGADAIYARLLSGGIQPLPGVSTIERILCQAGMTRPRVPEPEKEVLYPHLHPTSAHQLTQVDIVPHFLTGGASISCFNSIDVVSRYPAGQQYESKRSAAAADFLVHSWRALGLSEYVQMDNESCFSGGYKHPGVIGKVVRLALLAGVQPIFSPFYHPQSNGSVERFHQDYSDFVWETVHLEDLLDVRQRSALFFPNYRQSRHHSALGGKAPHELHTAIPARQWPADFRVPGKLPITEGQVHFLRAVDPERKVLILNQKWAVALTEPDQGVWATLFLTPHSAKLRIYDAAPDAPKRRCLAEHPFPLKEPVVPLLPQFRPGRHKQSWWQTWCAFFRHPTPALSTMS